MGSGDRITDLILRQGEISAEGARRSGELWGGLARGIGNAAGAMVEERAEKKRIEKMAIRDATATKFIESWLTGDDGGRQPMPSMSVPQYPEDELAGGRSYAPPQATPMMAPAPTRDPKALLSGLTKILGPDGLKIAQAVLGFASLTDKGDAKDEEHALSVAEALASGRISPQQWERWGGGIQQKVGPVLVNRFGAQPDSLQQPWSYEDAVEGAKLMMTARKGDIKTREMKVRNKDGSETIEIVEDKPGVTRTSAAEVKRETVIVPGANGPMAKSVTQEELAAGVPTYVKPEKGPRPNYQWVHKDGVWKEVPEGAAPPGWMPANSREQGRPVTSGDAGRVADFDTSLDDLNALAGGLTKKGATGTWAAIGAGTPKWVTGLTGWGKDDKKTQAVIDRVKQVIGKTFEGGVLRKEDEAKYEKILPTIGDDAEVVASKLDGLWVAVKQRRQTFMDSLGDAGFDTSKYSQRPGRERRFGNDGAPADAKPTKRANPYRKG